MLDYKDFSKKKYIDIDKDELQSDDVFICRNGNKSETWKYVVAIEHENKCEFLGKFEFKYLARAFAGTVAALRDAIDVATKEGVTCCIR